MARNGCCDVDALGAHCADCVPAQRALSWGWDCARGASSFWRNAAAFQELRESALRSTDIPSSMSAVVEVASIANSRMSSEFGAIFPLQQEEWGWPIPAPRPNPNPNPNPEDKDKDDKDKDKDKEKPKGHDYWVPPEICCLADGVTLTLHSIPGSREAGVDEDSGHHVTRCRSGAFKLEATFKWKSKRKRGEGCRVEWWEWADLFNARKDLREFPYHKTKTWTEMLNRYFEPDDDSGPAVSGADEILDSSKKGADKVHWRPESELELEPFSDWDHGCLGTSDYIYIVVRQRSGCPKGPTHEASIILIKGQGGVVEEVGGGLWGDLDIPPGVPIPGANDPGERWPPNFWTHDRPRRFRGLHPWVPRRTPFAR